MLACLQQKKDTDLSREREKLVNGSGISVLSFSKKALNAVDLLPEDTTSEHRFDSLGWATGGASLSSWKNNPAETYHVSPAYSAAV